MIEIRIEASGAVPKTLVELAVKAKKTARREAVRVKDDNIVYDEVWCVFDVDEHPNVAEACQQAHDNDIHVAVSSPCFELWLLLHFAAQNAHISRHDAQSLCRDHLTKFTKRIESAHFAALMENYDAAVARAQTLSIRYERDGEPAQKNPSTGMFLLTERLRELQVFA